MINKDKLKRRFSRGAREYDKYANVQKIMGDKLVNLIDNKKVHSILEIGCGTGYVTKKLVNDFPNGSITALDLAPGMIEYAQERVNSNKVNFICGDIESMDLEGKYDLIISNATFQWFNNLKETVDKLHDLLTPHGIILFSTFGEETFFELKETFLKASTELKIDPILPSQSFFSKEGLEKELNRNLQIVESNEVEYFNDCNEFFLSIKKIGANNSSSNRKKPNPTFIQKVMDIYNEDYRVDDKVKTTYHVIWAKLNK
ncbi:malonyl-ACP O-methyltransferase BioC [Anaeromicrobium sediminis]|uniref:Malonyl-[acyl-carrier protein] O-methyltransferase n=1 Tax=Anaeromicrobium sediminis TaxID=1478221 RepID=A0A267MJG8_9FIRM|nr:malonyl-ACP O-methyltransferase BioC [Anaeromicrobium sediminis]PAB59744.1 malonyl-[acyl-carrier protein] O-methyltransferase BioC [Anaeromicrobium sediminis]